MSRKSDIIVTLEAAGIELELEIAYTITSYGSPQSFEDPGDAPEFEIDKIMILDGDNDENSVEASRDIYDLVADNTAITSKIIEAIDDLRYDPDPED